MRRAALVFALFVGGCGLLEPEGPPARALGGAPAVPGAAAPDRPSTVSAIPPFPGYELAWNDEFDGAALDVGRWSIVERPWRDAVNARDSVVVANGKLSLVTFTAADGTHHTANINTKGKLEARYGYFEARVRFLDSAGQWCSFFLYPDTIGNPKGDPGTAGVEIDIFEHRDADDMGWNLRDMIAVGLNWDGFDRDWKRDHQVLAHPEGARLSHEWHTYAVLWTEAGHTFYIDDIPVWTSDAAISHTAEPVYLTCEVSDGSWAGYVPVGGYGSLEQSTSGIEVDFVRVWQVR